MALERRRSAQHEEETDGMRTRKRSDNRPDPEEAAKRFGSLAKMHHQFLIALDKLGSKDPKTQKIRKKICGELMELKLSRRCSIS